MIRSRRKIAAIIVVALVLVIGLWAWQFSWDFSPLIAWIEHYPVAGAIAYVILLAIAVLLLPVSSLPLVPLAAGLYGVMLTGVLSAAGWWLGGIIAFQIARHGRRYLERITSLESVDRFERKIPADIGFGGIVIATMIFPTGLVSFALGLLKRLGLHTFALASIIGILPFAFVWAYAGGELKAGRLVTFAAVAGAMVAAVLLLRRLWKRRAP